MMEDDTTNEKSLLSDTADAGDISVEQSPEQVQGTAQAPGQTDQVNDDRAAYKNDDGSYDFEKIFKDLSDERARSDDLRKQLSEPKKPDPFTVDDLSVKVADDEKEMVAGWVAAFQEMGLSREQADKVFQKLSEDTVTEEQAAKEADLRYRSELKKLGSERDNILGTLRSFTDTMVANKVWSDDERKAFNNMVCSADVARLLYNAVQNINLVRAGTFSNTPSAAPVEQQYSHDEQLAMYHKAFELMRSDKTAGEIEMKRLDKLFAKR